MTVDILDVEERARLHRALGDPHRLRIVDALRWTDRTPSELRGLTGLPSNLLAFHLDALDDVGIIERRRSDGDARRRYVCLRRERVPAVQPPSTPDADVVVFVCTSNSARSQLAAALWRRERGRPALSAGARPAATVHPLAAEVARVHGLDLSRERPRGYAELPQVPDLVVSVCDRAGEARLPWKAAHLHWSVADPADGDRQDFARAYREIERRVVRLADAVASS